MFPVPQVFPQIWTASIISLQIAKSVYSGFTASVGEAIWFLAATKH
jgi:hypothetical protein